MYSPAPLLTKLSPVLPWENAVSVCSSTSMLTKLSLVWPWENPREANPRGPGAPADNLWPTWGRGCDKQVDHHHLPYAVKTPLREPAPPTIRVLNHVSNLIPLRRSSPHHASPYISTYALEKPPPRGLPIGPSETNILIVPCGFKGLVGTQLLGSPTLQDSPRSPQVRPETAQRTRRRPKTAIRRHTKPPRRR